MPFGVGYKQAAAGVMVTASHNPKEDNGYKVYSSNGCQINMPEDQLIAESILRNLEPVTWDLDETKLVNSLDEVSETYFEAIGGRMSIQSSRIPKFMYTPMHGVGLFYMIGGLHHALRDLSPDEDQVFKQALKDRDWRSITTFKVVEAQALPDPNFTTVKFPNPEEAGALDLAKQEADKSDYKFIIANDPDADRLAVAEKISDGTWYQFKGDEVGVLLGYYMFQKLRAAAERQRQGSIIMLKSAVSSQMLDAIAATEGFKTEETLTGFKWIGNKALDLGEIAVFGYEEALGYMIPDIVHDKDGVAAASLFLEACSIWDESPYEVLQSLYAKYGYFETANTYWISPNTAKTMATFNYIKENVGLLKEKFGNDVKYRVRDLTVGTDDGTKDGKATLWSSPDNLMVTIWLDGLAEGLGEKDAEKRKVRCTVRQFR